jgi:hypothetical protein
MRELRERYTGRQREGDEGGRAGGREKTRVATMEVGQRMRMRNPRKTTMKRAATMIYTYI